ncbi:hypothetical protein, variant [Aphanomyces invadans]|uniref:HTH myb-type domain-containing protein n=1 Tax=Aphanomyces invadans TaxID=157072 RepID=A0A024UTV8_9STRA|nr:hypothetical protein, variant [Aphanomyces invadans]ETW09789.1 hypothetical protein, variant [Aphanomyces invadans]|eukprot:XP_008861200.1 hypothetical protein, variant [Aphanomyces invadans]
MFQTMLSSRAKQCRERWKNHLDPSINKGPYSSDEDMLLAAAYAELGNRWTQIANRLPGRTEDSVKMRWKVLNPHSRAVAKPGRPPLISTLGKPNDSRCTTSSSSSPAPSTNAQSAHQPTLQPSSAPSAVDPILHEYREPSPHPTEMSSWSSLDPDSADLISRRASSMFESFKERDSSLLSFASIKAEDWEFFRELVLSDHFAQAMPAAPSEVVSVFDSFKDKSMTDAEFRRLVGVIENPDAIMEFIHETYASMTETNDGCQCGCGGGDKLCRTPTSGCQHHDDPQLVASMQNLTYHPSSAQLDHRHAPDTFDSYGGQSNFQQTTSLFEHLDRSASFDGDDGVDVTMTHTFRVPKRRA